jgi:hypothetical protein
MKLSPFDCCSGNLIWARQKTRDATLRFLNASTTAALEALPGKHFDRYFEAFERVCARISGSG